MPRTEWLLLWDISGLAHGAGKRASCARRHGACPGPIRSTSGGSTPIEGIEHGVEINDRGKGGGGILDRTVVKRQGRAEGFKLV